ncbi:hypothetical protein LCGC14_1987400 [marine sediment metagenome]|uniref:histidine kinase n=2 Tax=root TaxID=1 RepID=A0A831QTF9_9FLAO|nr:PAS domain-containing sensor histidine kinase [Pricia antarctica]
MDNKEVILLKKALDRQKRARKQAEVILEAKSKELYDTTRHLKEVNTSLEHLLNEKTDELNSAFLNIIDPYIVMDLESNVLSMNTSAKEFLGCDHNKESINLSKMVHKDFFEYTIESMGSLLEAGVLKNYSAKITTKDNKEKWVQINASLIYDTERKPIAAQGIIRDITQEMEIKELLKEQKKQLNIIVEHSPLGILLSINGKIIKANTTFSSCLGYSHIELKQKKLDDISEAEDIRLNEDLTCKLRLGALDKFSVVRRYFRKNGGSVLARTMVSAVKDSEGKIEYEVALIEDITKERASEERLAAEREKYSSIIANMNLGLLEVDNDDIIQMANQSFCRMSGYEEKELLGTKAARLLGKDGDVIIEESIERRKKGISDSYEVALTDKQGNKKYWLISGAPRYGSDKELIGSIGIHLDITNQKLLEHQKEQLVKELEHSNKGLQDYAHIVSHDLKSPLRSISALATWIQEDYKDILDEGGNENLNLMQEKIASMDKLISGILDYSIVNSSKLNTEKVDLNTVVAEVGETIFIPDHVVLSVPRKLPIIYSDSTKMRQLFQNIIGNAVVHIEEEKGLVEVLYDENKTHWLFTIKDNGVGIPKEYHKKIFEIFQSVGNNERSTGIGLSIVKKIVDRYEGEVWVDSEVGVGTEFHFSLCKATCSM